MPIPETAILMLRSSAVPLACALRGEITVARRLAPGTEAKRCKIIATLPLGGNPHLPVAQRESTAAGSVVAGPPTKLSLSRPLNPLQQGVVTRPSRLRRSTSADDRAATLSAVTSIRRLVRVLRIAANRTQVTAGISAAQLFVLQQLGADTALSLNQLAAQTFTDRSSVAAVVDRLHTQGLLDRAVDPADRRRAAVRITAKGRRILDRAADAPTTVLIAALKTLGSRQRASLAAALEQLTVALGASGGPAPMLFNDDAKPPVRRRSSNR